MAFLQKKNSAKTTLSSIVSIGDTVISVADSSVFPSIGDFMLTIWNADLYSDPAEDYEMEIVRATSIDVNNITVIRAQENTSESNHIVGKRVAMLITAGTFNDTLDQNVKTTDEVTFDKLHAGVDSTIGNALRYWKFEEYDLEVLGKYMFLSGYSDGYFGNLAGISDNLIIFDKTENGYCSLIFVEKTFTTGILTYTFDTELFNFNDSVDITGTLSTSDVVGIGSSAVNSSALYVNVSSNYLPTGDNDAFGINLSANIYPAIGYNAYGMYIYSSFPLNAVAPAGSYPLLANLYVDGTTITDDTGKVIDYYGIYVLNPNSYATNTICAYFEGNAGFGVLRPTSRIHQDNGTATATYHKFTANATTGQTATDGFNIGIDASGNAEIKQLENLPLYFYTNNALTATCEADGDWNFQANDITTTGAITGLSFTIGANTLTTTEWAYLDGLNQSLATTSSPTFNAITATSIIIGANTLTTTEWAFLDGLNQSVSTTASPTFNDLSLSGDQITMDTGGVGTAYIGINADSNLIRLTNGDVTVDGSLTATSIIMGAYTVSATEWAFLDGQDQAVWTESSPTFANLVITTGGDIKPSANSTGALNIAQADGTNFVMFDTTNKRIGINMINPASALNIGNAGILKINSAGDDKNIQISHNDTNGLITSSDGTISFDNENLITTGTFGAGAITGTSFIIGANTLTTTEWAFLDGQDQSVFTTSSPTFNAITATSIIIGANTLTTAEWAYLDGQNQSVFTTSSPTFANLIITSGGNIYPSANSTSALAMSDAANTSNIMTFDTTNRRILFSNVSSETGVPGAFGGDIVSESIPWRFTKYSGGVSAPGAAFLWRSARGTQALPTAVLLDDQIAGSGVTAYHSGGSFSSSGSTGFWAMYAGENFTSTAQGTYHAWGGTAVGGVSRRIKMILSPSGTLWLGDSDNSPVLGTDFVDALTSIKLHLDLGNAAAVYQKFTAGTTTGRTATDGFDIGIDASANAYLRQYENLPMYFYTNNVLRMTIEADGDILMGAATTYLFTENDGDTYWVGSGTGLPYGACYGYDIAWTQATAVQNTWYLVSDADMVDGPLNLMTHDGNGKLTATNAGTYKIDMAISMENSGVNLHTEYGISIDGATPAMHQREYFGVPSEEQHGSLTRIITLTAGQTIELAIRVPDAGTPTLSVDNLSITVVMIGG